MWVRIAAWCCCLAISSLSLASGGALEPGLMQVSVASGLDNLTSTQLKQARQLLEAGSTEQAITLLRQAVKHDPANPDAHLLLGTALARVPMRSEALAELRAAVRLAPKSAPARYALGTALAGFAQFNDARLELEKAVELDPAFPASHVELALVLGQLNQEHLAKEHLRKAITLLGRSQQSAYPHYLLAQMFIHQGKFDAAERELLSAIRLKPDYPEAYLSLGLARRSLQNSAGALEAFQQAAALAPVNFTAQYEFGTALLRESKPSQAVEVLQKAVALEPKERRARFQLCRALQRAQRLQEAHECEEQARGLTEQTLAAESHGFEAAAANDRGMKLEKEGKLDQALEEFQRAVKLDPSQTVLRRNLAFVLCRIGRWKEGVDQLRQVLAQDPDDAEATRTLYIALDKLKSAEKVGSETGAPAN